MRERELSWTCLGNVFEQYRGDSSAERAAANSCVARRFRQGDLQLRDARVLRSQWPKSAQDQPLL